MHLVRPPADAAQRQLRVVLCVDGGDDHDHQVHQVHGILVHRACAHRTQRVGGVAGAEWAAGREGPRPRSPGVEGEQHERQQAETSPSPSGERSPIKKWVAIFDTDDLFLKHEDSPPTMYVVLGRANQASSP